MADSIPYALLLPFSKSDTKNNEGIFLFDNLLSLLDQDKEKKLTWPWELIVDDIAEVLEILLASPI